MTAPPKISIIIATYNSEATLPACLKSIVEQSYKDIEICIVDGASNDDTVQILTDWSSTYPVIKYQSEKDDGVFFAMNKGIDMSTGQWLYFLGSDDELASPDVLSEVAKEISTRDPDLIYGNISGLHTGKQYQINTFKKVIAEGISHQSIFYRKAIFDRVGKYDVKFSIAADYCLNLTVFLDKKFKIHYINKDIAKFGERGLSSNNYDYTFYSYYYKLLSEKGGLSYLPDPAAALDKSIYCCLYLAQQGRDRAFALKNLLYYAYHKNHLSIFNRFKIQLSMLRCFF